MTIYNRLDFGDSPIRGQPQSTDSSQHINAFNSVKLADIELKFAVLFAESFTTDIMSLTIHDLT